MLVHYEPSNFKMSSKVKKDLLYVMSEIENINLEKLKDFNSPSKPIIILKSLPKLFHKVVLYLAKNVEPFRKKGYVFVFEREIEKFEYYLYIYNTWLRIIGHQQKNATIFIANPKTIIKSNNIYAIKAKDYEEMFTNFSISYKDINTSYFINGGFTLITKEELQDRYFNYWVDDEVNITETESNLIKEEILKGTDRIKKKSKRIVLSEHDRRLRKEILAEKRRAKNEALEQDRIKKKIAREESKQAKIEKLILEKESKKIAKIEEQKRRAEIIKQQRVTEKAARLEKKIAKAETAKQERESKRIEKKRLKIEAIEHKKELAKKAKQEQRQLKIKFREQEKEKLRQERALLKEKAKELWIAKQIEREQLRNEIIEKNRKENENKKIIQTRALAEELKKNNVTTLSRKTYEILKDIRTLDWELMRVQNPNNKPCTKEMHIPELISSIILEIAKKHSHFVKNGKIVIIERGFDHPLLFTIDNIWVYPLRLFRDTEKDKFIISETSLKKFPVIYEEMIHDYLMRQFSFQQLDANGINIYSLEMLEYLTKRKPWEEIIIQTLSKDPYMKELNNELENTTPINFSFAVAERLLFVMNEIFPKEWIDSYKDKIDFVVTKTTYGAFNTYVRVGSTYLKSFSKNNSVFKLANIEDKSKQVIFSLDLESFLRSGKLNEIFFN